MGGFAARAQRAPLVARRGAGSLAAHAGILPVEQPAAQGDQPVSGVAAGGSSCAWRAAAVANSREPIFVSVGAVGGAFVRKSDDAAFAAHWADIEHEGKRSLLRKRCRDFCAPSR